LRVCLSACFFFVVCHSISYPHTSYLTHAMEFIILIKKQKNLTANHF
jgi:hypothetical protein